MARKKYLRITLLALLNLLIMLKVQVRAEEEESEGEDSDELITKLLDTPIGDTEESEVAKIMKVLEAAELASTTTTTPSTTTVSTTTTTTTPKPSPFFNTESPFSFASRKGNTESKVNDELIPFLDDQLKEVSQWIDEDEKAEGVNRRSDYHRDHDPPLKGLLWGTAKAMWDVSRPVFWKSKTGTKISLIKDTITLPIRTVGAIKSHIHDLKYHRHHHHHDDHLYHKRRSVHHHHPLDHGWGWEDPKVVYVKYEPENSLFKSWIRFLYRVAKPLALTKIKIKKALIFIKLKFLWKIIHLLKSAKLQKVFAALRAVQTKLQILKDRKHPNLVVLKETDTTKTPPIYGWGWGAPQHHHHHHPPPPPPPPPVHWDPHAHSHPPAGWSPPAHSHWESPWSPGPPPKAEYGPPPKAGYGAPKAAPKPIYGPPPPSKAYGAPHHHSSHHSPNLDITYGPPAKTSHGYHTFNPSNTYGSKKSEKPLRVAYNHENTYLNYRPKPSTVLTAPEPNYQASRTQPQQVESPSYAKYLQDFGINPSSLSELNPSPGPNSESTRYLRQSESDSTKELEVPYLIGNATEEIKKRM